MPTLPHSFGVFAVRKAKISKVLTDPDAGPMTFGTSVALPGIRIAEIGGTLKSDAPYGDMQTMHYFAFLESITVKSENVDLSLDALAIILGGTATDTGTTPAQIAKYAQRGQNQLGQFKLEAQCTVTDGALGDVHIVIPKLTLSVFPSLGFANGAFKIHDFTAIGVQPRSASDDLFDIVANETAVAVA